MKKTILTLLVALSSICIFAQTPTKLITYKNSFGEWNEYQKKYIYSNYTYSTITFSFYETYMIADDKNSSLYRIIETLEKIVDNDGETIRCKAMDENNRNCLIYLTSYKDCTNSVLTIFYSKVSYLYVLDK